MSFLKNDLIDVGDWPELDESNLVPVMASYAKARGLVWGCVTAGLALAFAGPLVAIEWWGNGSPPRLLWWAGDSIDAPVVAAAPGSPFGPPRATAHGNLPCPPGQARGCSPPR